MPKQHRQRSGKRVNVFRNRWLPAVMGLPADTFAKVPVGYLRELHPAVYQMGPLGVGLVRQYQQFRNLSSVSENHGYTAASPADMDLIKFHGTVRMLQDLRSKNARLLPEDLQLLTTLPKQDDLEIELDAFLLAEFDRADSGGSIPAVLFGEVNEGLQSFLIASVNMAALQTIPKMRGFVEHHTELSERWDIPTL